MSSYNIDCPIARTLDAVGERWTWLILRDFVLLGPRKFQDLQDSLTGISPTTLAARLKTLELNGIVVRRIYSTNPHRAEYVLSEKGSALKPVLGALRAWGTRYET